MRRNTIPAKNHDELHVYQLALESAMRIHELTRSFPVEERYSMTDQIRRCSRSVCANIAEAWRRRRYPNHFASKLNDAEAEAAETSVWLDFALRFGYLSVDLHRELEDRYDHVRSQLTVMMANPGQWIPQSTKDKPAAGDARNAKNPPTQ